MSKFLSLIREGDVHLAGDKKIVPANDFTTLADAAEILDKAKEEAARLKEETESACLQQKEEAKKAGYEEGLTQLNEQILSFDGEKKRLRQELNKLIIPLALKAAKKIVAKELELHPETIVDIVLQTLNPVLADHYITIWVNKADKEILEKEKMSIKEKLEKVESLLIKEREDVQPGGCLIETESGILNATIENQWRALEKAFDRYVKSL